MKTDTREPTGNLVEAGFARISESAVVVARFLFMALTRFALQNGIRNGLRRHRLV